MSDEMRFTEYVNRLEDAMRLLWSEMPARRRAALSETYPRLGAFVARNPARGRPNVWRNDVEELA